MPGSPEGRALRGLGLLLAVGAAFLAHRFVLDLALMGWDSYPLIAASRVERPADLLDSFREELMDGRHPEAHFYRPVTSLSFALDYATSGLRSAGYQRTNLLLQLAGVAALFALGRRFQGGALGPAVAALVFAIHPLQLETVPVAARRADLLFTLFLMLALCVQPLTEPVRRWRLLASAGLVLLAAASKETGAAALPVLAGAVWILPAEGDARGRTRRALRLCALPALALAGFVALRTGVLGGLGGHPGSALPGVALGVFEAPAFARGLLMPQPWTGEPRLDAALCAALALGLAACLVLAARRGERATSARPSAARLFVCCGLWLVCLLALTGLSELRASWYAVPFLPPFALLLGGVADAARRAWRQRRTAAGLALGGLVALLLGSQLRHSALLHRYEEWTLLSQQETDFLARFRSAVSAAAPGTTIRVEALPLGTGAPLEQVGIRSALGMTDYSVAAWAELALPERAVRVRLHTGGPPTAPLPGVISVDAVPLPSPALRLLPEAPR